MSQVLTATELLECVSEWRRSGQRVGFTCGAFDLLHAGHVDYLQRARAICDRLIVAVNSDNSIRAYKDPRRPILPEQLRLKVIAALSSVDAVTLLDAPRPTHLLQLLQPDFDIKGGDYRVSQLKSASLVERYGGECIVIPIEYEISTSKVIERVGQYLLHARPAQMPGHSARGMVLLDRDGTLIENVPFLKDPERVKLLPGVAEGLRALQDAGFILAIATNQQGLGLGYYTYDDFVAVNSALFRQLSDAGVRISRVFYCPHSFADHCECRKPYAKLILEALAHFEIQAGSCFLIGDAPSDIAAAEAAGIRGIRVSSEENNSAQMRVPDFRSATRYILGASLPLDQSPVKVSK